MSVESAAGCGQSAIAGFTNSEPPTRSVVTATNSIRLLCNNCLADRFQRLVIDNICDTQADLEGLLIRHRYLYVAVLRLDDLQGGNQFSDVHAASR